MAILWLTWPTGELPETIILSDKALHNIILFNLNKTY